MTENKTGPPAPVKTTPRQIVAALFAPNWRWATLLVVAAMLVMGRLGIWQLDRLEQRRARNAQTSQQLALPPLALTGDPLPDEPPALKTRLAEVRGRFDYSRQIVLKLQNWTEGSSPDGLGSPLQAVGVDIITPFVIAGTSKAVLVNRGWIPQAEADPDNLAKFNQAAGEQTVSGRILLSETLPPDRATAAPQQASASNPEPAWYRVDIQAIQAQMPYELLPIYLQEIPPADAPAALPYKSDLEFDLSEGPHMGYAIQWFLFALILGGGYLYYVNQTLAGKRN